LVKIGGQWKIKHCVLSMTVPNDNVEEVVKIKSVIEDQLLTTINRAIAFV
jgi:hypothetical protein